MIEHITRAVNLVQKEWLKIKGTEILRRINQLNSDRWKSALLVQHNMKTLLHLFTMIFFMCNAVFFFGGGGELNNVSWDNKQMTRGNWQNRKVGRWLAEMMRAQHPQRINQKRPRQLAHFEGQICYKSGIFWLSCEYCKEHWYLNIIKILHCSCYNYYSRQNDNVVMLQ